jgi:tetratricopeptide (TPR) repeat protein
MKFRFIAFFLIGFLYSPFMGFSQDSIPIVSNVNEEKLLKFQDHFFKALAQKSIYNYRVAIENLEECNNLKPKEVSVLFELSKNYLMMKRFLEAEEYAKQALEIEPANYWVLEHLSKTYIASSNIKGAIPIHERIAKQNPKEREKLVYLYFQNNELEKAKNILSDLEKENQLTPDLIQFKRQFLKEQPQKEEVQSDTISDLIQEFESDKNFETLQKTLTLLPAEDNQLLLEYSTIGLELYPAQAFMYLMNAKAQNNNKEYSKAIEQLTNGIDFVIDNKTLEADFYDQFAISYHGLGNDKEAIKNKNKALTLRKK